MRFGACACAGCGEIPSLHAVEVKPFSVNPVEAIDFFRNKTRIPTRAWTDLWQQQHSAGFMIAGAQSDALLADFQGAIDDAIARGETLDAFRKRFDSIVEEHGWSYNGSRNWRSQVIFDTNMRMAYSAGQWQQIQRVKEQRPYLRYVAVMDNRTRPEHAAWHNTVLPADDPWWQTHFPPNGWRCRCTVQSLNERDLERYGLQVADAAPASAMVARAINTPDGRRTVMVPKGIDPGFAYRPGQMPAETLGQDGL